MPSTPSSISRSTDMDDKRHYVFNLTLFIVAAAVFCWYFWCGGMKLIETLISIDAPHFNAGVVLRYGKVVKAAPILKYMIGWDKSRIIGYCFRKEWKTEERRCDESR